MSSIAPTPNVIRAMSSKLGKPADNSPDPIVQVINIKNVPSSTGARFRAVLSDGTHFVTSMLASQVGGADIKENCIMRIDEFMVNQVSNRTVIILLKITVLEQCSQRLGSPTDIEKSGYSLASAAAGGAPAAAEASNQPLYNKTNKTYSRPESKSAAPDAAAASGGGAANNTYGAPRQSPTASGSNPYGRPSPQTNSSGHQQPVMRAQNVQSGITPIASLNMYNNRWTIQARLTLKGDIRTWSNSKGEGTLFSAELLDGTMDVRATFFKEAVDKFYNMLEVGKVYTFSGGRLKAANIKYNNCQCPYEISFDQNSEIHLTNDDGGIAKQTYDFVKIADVERVEANKNIDILAVVKFVAEPANLISKKSGNELTKCDLTLVDDSGVEINLTVWGEKAKTAQQTYAGNPVVAFRNARVSDYGGKSLSGGDAADVAPDVPEAQQLSSWWAAGGAATTRSLSSGSGGGGKVDALRDRKSISAIKGDHMGMAEKPDWLSFKATLAFLKKDKEGGAWYPACANSGEPCKNRFKCTQTTDGQWYCDKCQGTYPSPVRRWIFSGVVEDSSSSTWVSFFNEQAESLFGGMTADECFNQSYGGGGGFDQDSYDSVFARALFTEWIFKCKVKQEFHNEEARVKTSVYSLHPVDYVKESNELLAAIEQM